MVTVSVVDDAGTPVEGADVGVGFSQPGLSATTKGVRGYSDSNGQFTARKTTTGTIHYGASKKGYYKSHYKKEVGYVTPGLKRFDPIAAKILLRKVENPVPMYARESHRSIDLPVVGEEVGFDLIQDDWVYPYGSGETEDFIFKLKRNYLDRKNYEATVELTFSNEHDGIILHEQDILHGSEFSLPREAPIEGYMSKLAISKSRSEETKEQGAMMSFKPSDNYLFRIRSEINGAGNIRAMYGKIVGPIKLGNLPFRDTASISFQYYLNPDFTRNLEHDPTQNLFGELPPMERVGMK